jgi:hypothetical protein
MLRSLRCLAFVLPCFALSCAAPANNDETDDDEGVLTSEAALGASVLHRGDIPTTGQSRTTSYRNPPRFVSYAFRANGGDELDVWVKGIGAQDPVAWVVDSTGKILGFNDDAAEGGLASHIKSTVPASLGTKARLRVVFRELGLRPATFTVSVKAKAKPGMFACAVDADCVKVSQGGCCTAWMNVAVNASRVADHEAANQCKPPYPPCAPPPQQLADIEARKTAACVAGQCVLREPAGCSYDNSFYSVGESFPSLDGCNTCTCGTEGSVGCTKRACAPPSP